MLFSVYKQGVFNGFAFAVVIAALASSIFAKPINNDASEKVSHFCWNNGACQDCTAVCVK